MHMIKLPSLSLNPTFFYGILKHSLALPTARIYNHLSAIVSHSKTYAIERKVTSLVCQQRWKVWNSSSSPTSQCPSGSTKWCETINYMHDNYIDILILVLAWLVGKLGNSLIFNDLPEQFKNVGGNSIIHCWFWANFYVQVYMCVLHIVSVCIAPQLSSRRAASPCISRLVLL